MCGADVEAACMRRQEEVIGVFGIAARCAVQGQVDGMGTTYVQRKLSALDGAYHGFFVSKENGEDSPQRAEWIGDDDFGLHASEQPLSSTPYRPSASIFVESLLHSTKRRRTSSKPQNKPVAVSLPKVDLINTLPDECLQEIFGFLPRVQDRCACASVCMRWLMLQSRMLRGDFKTESTRCKGGCSLKDGWPARSDPNSAAEKVEFPAVGSPDGTYDHMDEVHEEDGVASIGAVHTCGTEEELDVEEEPRVERQPQWAIGELSRNLEGRKATDVRLAFMAIGALARGGLGKLSIKGGSTRVGRGVTDSGLIAIGNCCAALRSLTLWECNNIGDVGMTAVGNGCRLLEKLDLMKSQEVGDAGLEAVAKGCPLLTTVNLDSCPKIGDAGLQAFGKWSGVLSSVSVSNCPMVGSSGISMIALGCMKLKKLKLEKIRLSNEGLCAIGEHCKSITRVKLANLGCCTEEGFLGFCGGSGLQQLKSLLISCCPGITDVSLEKVGSACRELKLCVLSQCQSVTDKGLKAFMQCCDCLDTLQLERCHSITHSGLFSALAQSKRNLKALNLSKCDGLCTGGDFLEDMPTSWLSLKTLQVTECKSVGNESLIMMGLCCPSLENLDLSGLADVSDEAIISVLQACGEHLVNLNLTKCSNITNAAVAAIASYCVKLRSLILDGCYQVGDSTLQMLALECTSLRELDASGTALTDSGVQSLVTLLGLWLQSLTLAGCVNLTDESLSLIEHYCPSLGALNLRNCPLLSSEGLSALQSQLWSCDFVCS